MLLNWEHQKEKFQKYKLKYLVPCLVCCQISNFSSRVSARAEVDSENDPAYQRRPNEEIGRPHHRSEENE